MDADDLVFYLNKANPAYPDDPVGLTLDGRVSLLTFICMYALLKNGSSVDAVNAVLKDDSLVLSENERLNIIRPRIDSFNGVIEGYASMSHVQLIDIGSYLNDIFVYGTSVDGVEVTRRWGRGNGFSMDGVHGSNTDHALMANYILNELGAPTYNPKTILMNDPYYDRDGDGWVQGPDYKASGRTKILFLFKDYQEGDGNDGSKAMIDTMSADAVWELISDALLEEIVDIPLIRMQAERMGLIPIK